MTKIPPYFSAKIKRELCDRVNSLCSNPKCGSLTRGPQEDPNKSINIGVAAHISAADAKDKRYDKNLTDEERGNIKNAIWLCQNCHKKVDNDEQKYTVEILKEWKETRESFVLENIGSKIFSIAYIHLTTEIVALNRLKHITVVPPVQLDRITDELEKDKTIKLLEFHEVREAWREGRREEADAWITQIRNDNSAWSDLSVEDKAEIISFEASITLQLSKNIKLPTQILEELKELKAVPNELRLRAKISYIEKGPKEAIKYLDNSDDIDSINLRAGYLIELGKIKESKKILDDNINIANAETHRILAILYVVLKDLDAATLEIRKAQDTAANWMNVKFISALIDYYSSLSTAAIADFIPSWPDPIDWNLVKSDDNSNQRRKNAEDTFIDLLKIADLNENERLHFQGWRLACIANDVNRNDEATIYCQELIQQDNTHYPAIFWAIARDFKIDLSNSITALNQRINNKDANTFHIIALININLRTDKAEDALEILEKNKTIFKEYESQALWEIWYVLSLHSSGDYEKMVEYIEKSKASEKYLQIKTFALHALGEKTGEWEQLFVHLEKSFKETENPKYLLAACDLKMKQQDWSYVSSHSKELIELISTPEAVRLGAISSYNLGDYSYCLNLLDNNMSTFANNKLSSELRHIKVFCLKSLGRIHEAILDQEAIIEDDPSTENIVSLADLFSSKGDYKSLAPLGERLLERNDLSTQQILTLSSKIAIERSEIAKRLWRKGIKKNVPDDLVGPAIELGFRLGLDNETRPLIEKMEELGIKGQGGIKIVPLKDVISMNKIFLQNLERVHKLYENGDGPVHALVERSNKQLSDLYHSQLNMNEASPDPTKQFALYARHGGRQTIQGFPIETPKWRLHLDITSILLAEHLEILVPLEDLFSPLHIPSEIVGSLSQMLSSVPHHQPLREPQCQMLIDLVESGAVTVDKYELPKGYDNLKLIEELGADWVAQFEYSRENNGYHVNYLPIKNKGIDGKPTSLPIESEKILINSKAIIDTLRRDGPLSKREYDEVISNLGKESLLKNNDVLPQKGSSLFINGNNWETLTEVGIFEIVCKNFEVHIEQSEYKRVREELKWHKYRQGETKWLKTLLDRIRDGLSNGTYVALPIAKAEDVNEKDGLGEGIDYKCMLSLLQFNAREGDVIWSDDRFINSFAYRDKIPIITLVEVLKSLVAANKISIEDYFKKLNKLRAGNVRFIPIEKDEIVFYLTQSRIQNNQVVETNDLSILRRYISSFMLRGEILQRPLLPDGTRNEKSEIRILVNTSRAIIDATIECWIQGNNLEESEIKSNWLFDNLYIDILGMMYVTKMEGKEQDNTKMTALSLSGLVSIAVSITEIRQSKEINRLKGYFEWLSDRILRSRFESDKSLLPIVSDHIKKGMVNLTKLKVDDDKHKATILVLQKFYDELPEAIKSAISLDSDFMNIIGLQSEITVVAGDLIFDQDVFWKGAENAVSGQECEVPLLNKDGSVKFAPHVTSNGRFTFKFRNPNTGKNEIFSPEQFELLHKSTVNREAALRNIKHWFELPPNEFNREIKEIIDIEDPRKRIERVETWINSSANKYYDMLHKGFQKSKKIKFSDLRPPSLNGLLRHLRIDLEEIKGNNIQKVLNSSAKILIEDSGLFLTINRYAGLPIPLPNCIIAEIKKYSHPERYKIIRQLVKSAGSPISKLHLLSIIKEVLEDNPVYTKLARRIIITLFSDQGKIEIQSFFTIMKWVSEDFSSQEDYRQLNSEIKLTLVWHHAHTLLSIFTACGAEYSGLNNIFNQRLNQFPYDVLENKFHYWNDIAHPRNLDPLTFLLSGMAYTRIGDENHILNKRLKGIIHEASFTSNGGETIPNSSLWKDSNLANNSMDSFLQTTWAETLSSILGKNETKLIYKSSNKEKIIAAIDSLTESVNNSEIWLFLYIVARDLPFYPELIDKLKYCIMRVDLELLYKDRSANFDIIIHFISIQIRNLEDSTIRKQFNERLLKVAAVIAKDQTVKIRKDDLNKELPQYADHVKMMLMESIFNVAIAVKTPGDKIKNLVDSLSDLFDIWPGIIIEMKDGILRLWEQLSAADAKLLWPLILKIRASK